MNNPQPLPYPLNSYPILFHGGPYNAKHYDGTIPELGIYGGWDEEEQQFGQVQLVRHVYQFLFKNNHVGWYFVRTEYGAVVKLPAEKPLFPRRPRNSNGFSLN